MRRFLYLIAFLLMSTLANAALWTGPSNGEYSDDTPIILQFKVNGELLTWNDQGFKLYSHPFAVAAFIGDECRGVTQRPTGNDTYALRVWGDASADKGKTITIKVLYGGLVFKFNKTYTYDSETHRMEVLEFDYPTAVEVTSANIIAHMPTTYDMASHISFVYGRLDGTPNPNPSNGATIENLNYSWYLGNYNNEFEAEDNSTVLTVKEGTLEGNYQIGLDYYGVDDDANYGRRFTLSAWADIKVTIPSIPVTSITYTGSAITCNVGDDVYSYITPYLTIAPSNASNQDYTISPDRAAFAAGAFDEFGRALKGGEWNIVVTANDGSGVTCIIPVKVKTPVSSIVYSGDPIVCYTGTNVYDLIRAHVVVNPSDADNKTFTVAQDPNEAAAFTNAGVATKPGEWVIYITANDGQGARTWVTVTVLQAVTSITYTGPDPLVVNLHDNVARALAGMFTVAPDDASDLSYTLAPASASAYGFVRDEAVAGGDFVYVATANDGQGASCNVNVRVVIPVSFKFPRALILSKYSDTSCRLTNVEGDGFDASLVDVVITDAQGNPFPAAVATVASQDGKVWNFRGKYVSDGDYKFYFTYNGNRMTNVNGGSEGDLVCPPEMKLPENGWDWIMVPGDVNLISNGSYDTDLLSYNATNKVIDVRSQNYLLYNDPESGLFGDLTMLSPSEGMYKVKAQYADYGVIDLSAYGLSTWDASAISLAKPVSKGYTWIAYPKEFDCTVADWNTNDDIQSSREGDLLIGKTGFAEFDGTAWQASGDFQLQAGKGYIYYTESTDPFYPTLGTDEEVMSPAPARIHAKNKRMCEWTYDHTQYADNMAIVAQLEGMDETEEDLCIGAFVGDECRGVGYLNATGKFFISVAGKARENVTLRICNTSTGETADINETLSFSMRQGSLKAPVMLTANGDVTGISRVALQHQTQEGVYDLSGRKLDVMNGRGLYIVNGKKVIVK